MEEKTTIVHVENGAEVERQEVATSLVQETLTNCNAGATDGDECYALEPEAQEEKTAPDDTIVVKIKRTNAAFADDPVLQTNLCLAEVAMQLIEDQHRISGALHDVNGNTVGEWWREV